MRPLQLVAGGEVIELGSLNGRGGLRPKDQQYQERRSQRAYCQAVVTISREHRRCPLVRPRTFERHRVVALLALEAEATSVNVLTRMTGTADHRWLDDVLRPDMAIGATYLCVGTR